MRDGTIYELQRTLVLQDEQRGRPLRVKCKFHYLPKHSSIDFASTLQQTLSNHPKLHALLEGSQLFYRDSVTKACQFLGSYPLEQAIVPYEQFSEKDIAVVYRKPKAGIKETRMQQQKTKSQQHKKSRERTIRQVRHAIDQWREKFRDGGVNLKQAASSIGMSKKTLDDYLRYMRLGTLFGFDFDSQPDCKMGVLRSYVKNKSRRDSSQLQNQDVESYLDASYAKWGEVEDRSLEMLEYRCGDMEYRCGDIMSYRQMQMMEVSQSSLPISEESMSWMGLMERKDSIAWID